jgi:transcriptional regulator with XRE-family HTH domain
MSQERFGRELGVSFQQIQKYEKGSNRVSAARLYEICQVL